MENKVQAEFVKGIDYTIKRFEKLKVKQVTTSWEAIAILLDEALNITAACMGALERSVLPGDREGWENDVIRDLLERVKSLHRSKIKVQEGDRVLVEDCDNCPSKEGCELYKPGGYTLQEAQAKQVEIAMSRGKKIATA